MSKTVITRGGEYKCRVSKMHLKSRAQQLKTIILICIYRLLYKNLMVIVNQNSIIDVHTKKKNKSKRNTKDSYQITREQKKKGGKKTYKNKSKTINKMTIGTYISIIALYVNTNQRHRLADWILKTRPVYMLPTRDSLQI